MANPIAELMVLLGADVSDYEKNFGKASKASEKYLDGLKDFGEKMSIYVTAPILAAATAITVWAAEEETADARLASSLRNVGVSYDKVTGQVHQYISGLESLSGFEDTSLENAFTSLINITGSASTSMQALGVTTDVAAGTGKSLEEVSLAVGKALDGQNTALKRMGVTLTDGMTPMQVLTALTEKFGGTAEKVAATVQGKWNQIKNAFQNVAETLGHAMEPTTKAIEDGILKAIGEMQKLASAFAQQPQGIKTFIVSLGAVVAAIGPIAVAVATLGTWILKLGSYVAAAGGWSAMVATLGSIAAAAWTAVAPFIVWPAAILAVVAAFAFFYANGNKVATAVAEAFMVLLKIATDTMSQIVGGLESLFTAIGGASNPISTALREAQGYITGFSTGAGDAIKELGTEYDAAGGYISNTTGLIKGVFNDMAAAIGLNTSAITTAVNTVPPAVAGLGPPLDQNKQKWADWAASLKVTVQDLATGIHTAFVGMAQGITEVLTSGSGDWRKILLDFLKASLTATTAWAVAKMTIFQTMSEALAAAISGPWGWVIIPGLIAATIAVGQASIPALATGGMTGGPMTAMIGDNPSGQEVVLPLDSPQTTNALAKAMPQGGAGSGTLVIPLILNGREIAQAVIEDLPEVLRMQGIGS